MKNYKSYDEETKELFERYKQKFMENDDKDYGDFKGLDGPHTQEDQRLTRELNHEWQRIADKWGVELKKADR